MSESTASSPSLIAASGTAEARGHPDRATILIGVRAVSDTSAAEAARDSVPAERGVIAALEQLDVSRRQVTTASFDIGRERLYEHGKHRLGQFYIDHVYEVELHDVDRVGAVIAAVRRAGAARIANVRFWIADEELLHIRAARDAIARARSRAEAMAEAAGETLGRIVRLGTPEALAATLGAGHGTDGSTHRLMDSALYAANEPAGEAESILLPGAITVSVTVHAAWECGTR
jgi:uncharacterized protein YggE